jgi:hypothetical protein
MKLLDPKSIDRIKASDKKLEIDQGLGLAKRVDTLRATLLTEERNLELFRTNTVVVAYKEYDKLLEKIQIATGELAAALSARDEARKPLDAEWVLLREAQVQLENDRSELSKKEFQLTTREEKVLSDESDIEKDREKLEVDKASIATELQRARTLRVQREGEFAKAQKERIQQEKDHQSKISIVSAKERKLDYDIRHNADFNQTLKLKEQVLDTRETRLTIRENASKKRTN